MDGALVARGGGRVVARGEVEQLARGEVWLVAEQPGAVPSTAHQAAQRPLLSQWQRGARCFARATGQQSAVDRQAAKSRGMK